MQTHDNERWHQNVLAAELALEADDVRNRAWRQYSQEVEERNRWRFVCEMPLEVFDVKESPYRVRAGRLMELVGKEVPHATSAVDSFVPAMIHGVSIDSLVQRRSISKDLGISLRCIEKKKAQWW